MRRGGKSLCASSCDENDVFNAESPAVWKVDAGLVGHDHPGLQHLPVALDEIRRLVNAEPQSMPEAVKKRFGEAVLGEHLTGDLVDLLAGHARTHGCEGSLLCFKHGLVRGCEIGSRSEPATGVRVMSA